MKHVENSRTVLTYRGDGETVGDLKCERVRPGIIRSFWQPSEDELTTILRGGYIELCIYAEPIPPVALNVVSPQEAEEEYRD